MGSPSETPPGELSQLQTAAARALRDSLSDPAARAALESAAKGDASLTQQLTDLYATFAALVSDTSASVIDAWGASHALVPTMAAVARAGALADYSAGSGEADAAPVREGAVWERAIAERRERLERVMAEVEKEERKTANIRVETKRMEDVMGGIDRRVAGRAGEVGKAVGGDE